MTDAPRLIGLSGYARSGKDTFANALVEGCGYELHRYSQALKDMLLAQDPIVLPWTPSVRLSEVVEHVGWEGAKKIVEVRRLLQALGTEAGRGVLGEDVWIDAAMRKIPTLSDGFGIQRGTKAVFADVRFRNEAQAIADRGGIIVRIERPGVGALNGHDSEIALDDWSFDYVVRNEGTVSELRRKAFDVVAKEMGSFDWPSSNTSLGKVFIEGTEITSELSYR